MTTDFLFITNRFGEKLETLIRKPHDSSHSPVIIFVAGIGADLHETKNSHDDIAVNLQKNGFVTLQFSFAGRGNSDGNYNEMTIDKQADQIEDILEWTKTNVASNKKVGIYAMSFGVPCVLAAHTSTVSSFCLVSGAYFPHQAMEKMFRLKGEYKPDETSWRKFSTGEIVKVKQNFWQSLSHFDQKKTAQQLTQPVLMIHGNKDDKITVSDVQKVFANVGSQQKKLKIFPNGDHGIIDVSPSIRQEFLHDVVQWFQETL